MNKSSNMPYRISLLLNVAGAVAIAVLLMLGGQQGAGLHQAANEHQSIDTTLASDQATGSANSLESATSSTSFSGVTSMTMADGTFTSSAHQAATAMMLSSMRQSCGNKEMVA